MKKHFVIIIVLLATSVIFSQSPCKGTPTVNFEGKAYQTVQIGKQCWLKENLDVGTMIKTSQAETNNGIIEKYCYNNDINNCKTYGGLYNWAEAVQYKNSADTVTAAKPKLKGKIQGICPQGWHIPNQEESYQLGTIAHAGTSSENANVLKEIGQGSGVFAGTNTTGFSAMIYKYTANEPGTAFFWNSDEANYQGDLAYSFYILGMSFYSRMSQYKYQRLGVRCLKD